MIEIPRDPNAAAEQRRLNEMCTPGFISELRAQVARQAGEVATPKAVDIDN